MCIDAVAFSKIGCVLSRETKIGKRKMDKKSTAHQIEILKALDCDIHEHESINISEGFRKTQQKIKRRSRKEIVYQTFYKTAAIIAVPLLISTFVLLYLYQKEAKINTEFFSTEIVATPGSIIKTQLPDQSMVWLNSGSSLSYPSKFTAQKRTVKLVGEAFFEVKSDKQNPFEVEIPNGIKVIAKGTSFNVNAYEENPVYEAALQAGIIDVQFKNKTVTLQPNEMLSFAKENGRLKQSKVNIDEKTAWRDGKLIFRNTPLKEVFHALSRRHNVEFILHKEPKEEYEVWATFTTETITQILDILKIAAPITWSIREVEQQENLTYSKQCIEVWIK